MKIIHDGRTYVYPMSLTEITLGQAIELEDKIRTKQEDYKTQIDQEEDKEQKQLIQLQWQLENAVDSFSFYTGISSQEVKSNFDVLQIVQAYNAAQNIQAEESKQLNDEKEFEFNNELWCIESYELTPKSKMTFNEFLTAKEMVRQMQELGQGNTNSLLYLCCVYLRKHDEPFTEELIDEDGERMELMRSLPMNIALSVGFFLTSITNLYLKDLLSLREVQETQG